MTSTLLWILVALQIAMGAFDTLYHHEMTERLAWRPSQGHELALHALRNMLYAVLFTILGLTEVHGWWALLVVAIVVAEVIITLMDFVEEDVSRRLPASERINHTLLALNYGAILVLLIPILLDWSRQPTAIVGAFHGIWSVLAALAGLGVALFGLRDLVASRRVARLAGAEPARLAAELPARQIVLVTGATGFVGRRLVAALSRAGHTVIALVRDPAHTDMLKPPITLITSLDQIADNARIDAIVNLAGEPISNGLWTSGKRRAIVGSRLRMTGDLVRLVARLLHRPKVLVSGSAIGWYGVDREEPVTESAEGHASFSHDLCAAWESAAARAEAMGVRVAFLRIGLVLGSEGGLLASMLTPFEFGLGGAFGSGRQWMSWIERDDLVRLIVHIIASPALSGPINATAPEPVTNDRFVAELGRRLHRPARMRIPAGLLHRIGGAFADELLLGGQRVLPRKALESGFVFQHATLASAFRSILGTRKP